MGDRSQVLIFIIAAFIVYWMQLKRKPSLFILTLAAFSLLLFNYIVKVYRSIGYNKIFENGIIKDGQGLMNIISAPFVSVESFAAYASMPYIIINELLHTYGASLYHFILAFIPRFLAPFRVNGSYSYNYYAEHVGVLGDGRGYTFHHVADWYLNFHLFGIVFGGLLIGLFFGFIEKKAYKQKTILWIICFALLVGFVPSMLRTSIDGMRAIFYELWLIPFCLFVCLPFIKRKLIKKM